MLFTFIFVSLYVMGWCFFAFLPWLAFSIATRGHAGLAMLPLCLFAGVVAGLALPVLGADSVAGFWLSFVAAAAVSLILLTVRRATLRVHTPQPAHDLMARQQEGPDSK